MPKISVIIPVYNARRTLRACLASIFAQSLVGLEIIAVNDGSTDGSLKILSEFQGKITIIDQKNQGAAAARNAGAKIATAPYLIFCDADIVMKTDMLEKMYEALQQNPQAAYVYSAFRFGRKVFKLWPFAAERLRAQPYIHTTSLIRRDRFPGFDQKLKRFQDWDLWLTMLQRGSEGYFIPEVLFQISAQGTMSSWLPACVYKFLPFLPAVKKFRAAERIIKIKHKL